MGTCIPGQLFDYLSHKQKSLESLILVTDGACAYNYDGLSSINLSVFPCLRKLSWRGMRSKRDMKALEVALKRVSHQLVELELDFMNKEEVHATLYLDDDELDNFLTHSILGLPSENRTRIYPAVQVLSLSKTPFDSVAQDIAHAFNWGLLRSLTLRFCEGWEDFLFYGSGLSCPATLKALKIQATINEEIDAERSISTFLGSFQGLEQLLLSNFSPSTTLDIWHALIHHKATLRTFVHHQRGLQEDLDSEDFREDDSDSPDLTLTLYTKEMMKWSEDRTTHPLSGLDLEFLSLCCEPKLLMVLAPTI
jgi:hypothetical protein